VNHSRDCFAFDVGKTNTECFKRMCVYGLYNSKQNLQQHIQNQFNYETNFNVSSSD